MIELWYSILAFTLIGYVLLDGRNFGVGILHRFVARTPDERRQVIEAIEPFMSWDEVWLITFGGLMFVAFPRLMASAFSGYYLALFLILWCLVLRTVAAEVGGHLNDWMWQAFWDFVTLISNVLLAILFGVALGNEARGVPLDANGDFHMAFFTNFSVRGNVGLLDWYTISMAIVCLVVITAHGASYLALRTDGPVHERCVSIMKRLWSLAPILFLFVSAETWYVRPQLALAMMKNPMAWLGVLIFLSGSGVLLSGLRRGLYRRTFVGSNLILAGLLIAGAATVFPVFLYSTLDPANSLTAYNSAASRTSLEFALMWWVPAITLSCSYYAFVVRRYPGKVKLHQADRDH